MFDLKLILKDLQVKEKPERKATLLSVAQEDIKWNYEDKTVNIATLSMTKYQLYWLMWRVRVHLRSYDAMEWSEMKDVLTIILKQLEGEWERCQFMSATNVKESSPSGLTTPVGFASTHHGL
jgi:hypothetical protein